MVYSTSNKRRQASSNLQEFYIAKTQKYMKIHVTFNCCFAQYERYCALNDNYRKPCVRNVHDQSIRY